MHVGARNFLIVKLDQDVLPHRFLKQVIAIAVGAVGPKNFFRFGEELDFVHPVKHGLVRRLVVTNSRWRRNGGRDVFHYIKMSILVESSGSRISSGSGGSPRIFSRATNVACVKKSAAVYCSMFGVTTSDDYRPVTWVGRYPVRVTTIIATLYVLGMFFTTIAQSAHWGLLPFAFQSRSFLHGPICQPCTCIFIQPASFFFLFNVIFFYWAGTEVEI